MKLSTKIRYGLALFAVFLIALFLRTYFNYHNVFASGWVNFQETDNYFHMRQVLMLALHFPHRMLIDPYGLYPGGMPISQPPFFYLLWGFFAWVFGAGSPTQKVIETVGAYLPAIVGALVTVPVYFIGKELFNKKAGLIGAALVGILPGAFLWRSMLGFPEYHVTEVLFSATAMMFLILAVKSSGQNQVSFESLRKRDWGTLRRPLLYSVLAGIALGVYLLTWQGGGLFIFIIFVFAVIQFVIDHLRGKSTDYLCIATGLCFLIALFMVSACWNGYGLWNLQFAALLIGILAFLALGVLSFLMTSRDMKRIWYPAALVVLGGIGAALFYVADPSLFRSILDKLSVFSPSAGYMTVAEVQRLTLSMAWSDFAICLYLALIALVIIAYLVIKEGAAEKTLLLIWSLVILAAAVAENRFAYYFAVNVALLTAYLSWRALQFAGLREAPEGIEVEEDTRDSKREKEVWKTKRGKKGKRDKKKAKKQQQGVWVTRYLSARNVYVSLILIVVFFLAFYPNIGLAIARVQANTGVDADWHESLVWMRYNTPDPFNNPDFYYELYQRRAGGAYQYPESAYAVMSWWDYGYFITYIAHRIPNANPSQSGATDAGLFFTAQDEASGSQILDRLGSKYVIIDASMATGKFYAMAIWAGKDQSQFFDVFYQTTQTGTIQPVMLYYPEFYQSMCSRLYFFAGEQWVPQQVTAISWTEQQLTNTNGGTFTAKVISDEKSFSNYDDAKAFVDANTDYHIVGTSPLASPVPLEKLEHYKLIHQSPTIVSSQQQGNISEVEIFEYSP
jgi:dolichyl-diphosphooligosaccharide--protein glycosyltransferase